MVENSTAGPSGRSNRLIRAYGWICVAGAVLGMIMVVVFLAAGDGFMAGFFAIFTLLLIPAFLCFRWAVRRRGW